MKKITLAALITLGLGGVAFTAVAQHGHGPRGPALEELDLNQDGNISKDEISAHRATKFADADANGDGVVSAEEFSAFAEAEQEQKRAKRQAKRFAKLDTNGDGVISSEEHAAMADKRMDRMFSRIDKDGDGVISEAELEVAKEKMREHRGKRGFERDG